MRKYNPQGEVEAAEGEPFPGSCRGRVGTTSFHTSLSFYVINFNCGNRTHVRKAHTAHMDSFTIHVKKQDIPYAPEVTGPF